MKKEYLSQEAWEKAVNSYILTAARSASDAVRREDYGSNTDQYSSDWNYHYLTTMMNLTVEAGLRIA